MAANRISAHVAAGKGCGTESNLLHAKGLPFWQPKPLLKSEIFSLVAADRGPCHVPNLPHSKGPAFAAAVTPETSRPDYGRALGHYHRAAE